MPFSSFPLTDIVLLSIFAIISIPLIQATLQAPFVPTPFETTRKMLKLINLKPGQIVYDLGCGDGRFVRIASREYGVTAIGIELNPLVYVYAKIRSLGHKNEKILFQDFMQKDLSDADIIVCYLLPKTMGKIEKKLQKELKAGALIVSHGFQFKNWQPLQTILPIAKEYGKIYLYQKK